MLKTIPLLLLLLFSLSNLSAQKESNIKLKIEAGGLWDAVEGRIYFSGLFLNVEPKLKTSKNTEIGLRIGAVSNTQAIKNSDPNQFYIDRNFNSSNGITSFMPTFDYYFTNKKNRPYLGVGVGYYFLTTSKEAFNIWNFSDALELSVTNQVGFLLRGGMDLPKVVVGRLDLSKFMVGLEFNYIPNADVEMPNGQIIGTINKSNVALSIGYIIGSGKG